jgi:hypothetical protein
MKRIILIIAILALIISITSLVITLKGQEQPLGSVSATNEYNATTTPSGVGAWTDQLIHAGRGSLGSVIITKAGDTEFVLYDATSTGAVINDGSFNKSNKQLVRVTENLVAGTYTFDTYFNDGLVIDVVRGTTGTSTITWRY